jgi:hypothetical protein
MHHVTPPFPNTNSARWGALDRIDLMLDLVAGAGFEPATR